MMKLRWKTIAFATALWTVTAMGAAAQKFTKLVNFTVPTGTNPAADLVQGRDGSLYSTTPFGGSFKINSGAFYKLSTTTGALTALHVFCLKTSCLDGAAPEGGVVLAADGNFYGTAQYGGPQNGGTVFKITAAGEPTPLYSFCSQPGCADGEYPLASLVQGTDGNFYGTTYIGGGGTCSSRQGPGCGTVFKITSSGVLTTLHTFDSTDGGVPEAGLIQGTDGNFYGTTSIGGTSNNGTVFRITAGGTLTTLHSFDTTEGSNPSGSLIQASDGNFYGTTSGGSTDGGSVFKITPAGTLTALYQFSCSPVTCVNGYIPSTGLIQATDGNLYGATVAGGNNPACRNSDGCGTIFQITLDGTLTTLYSFGFASGVGPSGLLQATDGNFYGTAYYGGKGGIGNGTAFQLSMGLGPFVGLQHYSGKVGGPVGIFGQGFSASTTVSFNGTPASLTLKSGTYLIATVPAGATTGFLTVSTPNLTSNRPFRVLP